MAWKNALALGKRIFDKTVDSSSNKNTAVQDNNLPLGGRIGGCIELQKSPFILAQAQGSFVNFPNDNVIKAISSVKIDESNLKIYRYYLQTGDDDKSQETYLQLFVENNEVTDAVFCQALARFIPETAEEQMLYTGENNEGLGEQTYTLTREMLESVGFSEEKLTACFGINDALDFYREINATQDFVKPIFAKEIRLDDAKGIQGLEQDVYFMPYARYLADEKTQEFLIISFEIVKSRDGDFSKRDIHVDFMTGLTLDKTRIQIF